MITPTDESGGGSRRPPYDLVTAAADYPAWDGPPQRSVLVCSHPRSGSTLLGEALYWAGGVGCPLEYLHRGFRPTLAARWQTPGLSPYVQALYRWRTDPSGVLSCKLFWFDLEATARERADGSSPSGVLSELFPQPVFIYLRRRDRVRQAVSAFVAQETGTFRALGTSPSLPPPDITYSYDSILDRLASADSNHRAWTMFFRTHGIVPFEMCYEDLLRDYVGAVNRALSFLSSAGVRAFSPVRPDSRPRLQRQADRNSERLVARFLADHAERCDGAKPPTPSNA